MKSWPLNLWAPEIQWAGEVLETFEFQTKVIESRDGTEQRIANRNKPRVRLEFNSAPTGDDLRRAMQHVSEQQGRQFWTPYFRQGDSLSADAAVDDTDIQVSASPPSRVTEAKRLLAVRPGHSPVVLRVNSVPAAGTITLEDALDEPLPAGTKLWPLIPGRLDGSLAFSGFTSRAAGVKTSFQADPVDAWHPSFGAAATLLDGLEYFTAAPNWATPVETAFSQFRETFDMGRGAIGYGLPQPRTVRVTRREHLLRSESEVDALLGLFYRCKGRQKPFYAPVWADELRPESTIQPGLELVLPGQAMNALYADNATYNQFEIRLASGTTYRRKIAAWENDGDRALLTLSASTGALPQIEPEQIASFHWIVKCRWAVDALTLTWQTNGVATAQVAFQTVGGE